MKDNVSVKIINIWETDFDDIRGNVQLYKNDKLIGNIIASYDREDVNESLYYNRESIESAFKALVLKYIDKYLKLPKISKCSKLMQEIYDNVCESEATMCHITDEDWKDLYSDRFTNKDIEILKEEVKKYQLDDIVTFNDNEYKILGYGNLETSFNDDRKIIKNKEIER